MRKNIETSSLTPEWGLVPDSALTPEQKLERAKYLAEKIREEYAFYCKHHKKVEPSDIASFYSFEKDIGHRFDAVERVKKLLGITTKELWFEYIRPDYDPRLKKSQEGSTQERSEISGPETVRAKESEQKATIQTEAQPKTEEPPVVESPSYFKIPVVLPDEVEGQPKAQPRVTPSIETQPPPSKKEIPKEVVDKYKESLFGMEELEKIEGFADLSPGQQLLVLENFKQINLGRLEVEAVKEQKKKTSELGLLGRVWQGITERHQLAKQKKEIKEKREKLEETDETKKENLKIIEDLTKGMKEIGLGVEIKDEKLEVQYVSFEKDFKGLKPKDEKEKQKIEKAISGFNQAASDFRKMPFDWGKKIGKIRGYGRGREYKEFNTIQKQYTKTKDELLRLKEEKLVLKYGRRKEQGAREEVQLWMLEKDSKISLDQFFNSHPDVERALLKIKKEASWFRGVLGVLKERGFQFGSGFALRSLAVGTLGTMAIPITGGALAGWYSKGRAEKALLAEQKARRLEGEEKQKEEVTAHFVRAEVLINKLKYLLDKEKEYQGLEGTTASPEEKNKIRQGKERIQKSLKGRIDYCQSLINQGLIDFGPKEKQIINRYELVNVLGNALTVDVVDKIGQEKWEKRIGKFLKKREKGQKFLEKQFVHKKMLPGVMLGIGFSTAGGLVRYGLGESGVLPKGGLLPSKGVIKHFLEDWWFGKGGGTEADVLTPSQGQPKGPEGQGPSLEPTPIEKSLNPFKGTLLEDNISRTIGENIVIDIDEKDLPLGTKMPSHLKIMAHDYQGNGEIDRLVILDPSSKEVKFTIDPSEPINLKENPEAFRKVLEDANNKALEIEKEMVSGVTPSPEEPIAAEKIVKPFAGTLLEDNPLERVGEHTVIDINQNDLPLGTKIPEGLRIVAQDFGSDGKIDQVVILDPKGNQVGSSITPQEKESINDLLKRANDEALRLEEEMRSVSPGPEAETAKADKSSEILKLFKGTLLEDNKEMINGGVVVEQNDFAPGTEMPKTLKMVVFADDPYHKTVVFYDRHNIPLGGEGNMAIQAQDESVSEFIQRANQQALEIEKRMGGAEQLVLEEGAKAVTPPEQKATPPVEQVEQKVVPKSEVEKIVQKAVSPLEEPTKAVTPAEQKVTPLIEQKVVPKSGAEEVISPKPAEPRPTISPDRMKELLSSTKGEGKKYETMVANILKKFPDLYKKDLVYQGNEIVVTLKNGGELKIPIEKWDPQTGLGSIWGELKEELIKYSGGKPETIENYLKPDQIKVHIQNIDVVPGKGTRTPADLIQEIGSKQPSGTGAPIEQIKGVKGTRVLPEDIGGKGKGWEHIAASGKNPEHYYLKLKSELHPEELKTRGINVEFLSQTDDKVPDEIIFKDSKTAEEVLRVAGISQNQWDKDSLNKIIQERILKPENRLVTNLELKSQEVQELGKTLGRNIYTETGQLEKELAPLAGKFQGNWEILKTNGTFASDKIQFVVDHGKLDPETIYRVFTITDQLREEGGIGRYVTLENIHQLQETYTIGINKGDLFISKIPAPDNEIINIRVTQVGEDSISYRSNVPSPLTGEKMEGEINESLDLNTIKRDVVQYLGKREVGELAIQKELQGYSHHQDKMDKILKMPVQEFRNKEKYDSLFGRNWLRGGGWKEGKEDIYKNISNMIESVKGEKSKENVAHALSEAVRIKVESEG